MVAYTEERGDYSRHIMELTKLNTSDSFTYTINTLFLPFFDYENFRKLTTNGIIYVHPSDPHAKLIEYQKKNPLLSAYYKSIRDVPIDDVALNALMKTLAEQMTDYFVMSTLLYGHLYDNLFKENEFKNIFKAYLVTLENLNTNSGNYNNNIMANVELNNTFVSQDLLLKHKETAFNKEKNNVITLMSKIHKGNKTYNTKRFWQALYLVIFIIYLLFVITTSFSINTRIVSYIGYSTIGLILLSTGCLIFVSLTSHEVIQNIKHYSK